MVNQLEKTSSLNNPNWNVPSGVQSSGGWRRDEARVLIEVISLCSQQCFDAVDWVMGSTSNRWKVCVSYIQWFFLFQQVGEENWGRIW